MRIAAGMKKPPRTSPPGLRPSTREKGEVKGLYSEDETGFEPGAQMEEGNIPDLDEKDTSRRLYANFIISNDYF